MDIPFMRQTNGTYDWLWQESTINLNCVVGKDAIETECVLIVEMGVSVDTCDIIKKISGAYWGGVRTHIYFWKEKTNEWSVWLNENNVWSMRLKYAVITMQMCPVNSLW